MSDDPRIANFLEFFRDLISEVLSPSEAIALASEKVRPEVADHLRGFFSVLFAIGDRGRDCPEAQVAIHGVKDFLKNNPEQEERVRDLSRIALGLPGGLGEIGKPVTGRIRKPRQPRKKAEANAAKRKARAAEKEKYALVRVGEKGP